MSKTVRSFSFPIWVALNVPEPENVPLYVPSFGKSAAIAAAPKAMLVLSVKADNMHVRDCIELSSHDQSLIVSERPAFFGSPALDASQRLRRIEVRPKYLRRALSVHPRPGFGVKRRIGLGAPGANTVGSRPYLTLVSRERNRCRVECRRIPVRQLYQYLQSIPGHVATTHHRSGKSCLTRSRPSCLPERGEPRSPSLPFAR